MVWDSRPPKLRMSSVVARFLLSLLVALALSPERADAFRCYICNSRVNESCASPPDKMYEQECTHPNNDGGMPFSVCRLQIVERDGITTIDRRCGWSKQREKDHCILEPRADVKTVSCECHSEVCNAAPALHRPAGQLMVYGAALAILLSAAIGYR